MLVPKKYYSWEDIERMVSDLCQQITLSDWRPDYIVGITRGGNIPATMISSYFNCRGEALKVKLRDVEETEEGTESNFWMAEDAYGYDNNGDPELGKYDPALRKNILIVDDINDSGATFNWIKNDWQSGCLPNSPQWENVWGQNVRFAVLTDNLSSNFEHKVNYFADEVNKQEQNVWLVYPWEEWWK